MLEVAYLVIGVIEVPMRLGRLDIGLDVVRRGVFEWKGLFRHNVLDG